MNPFEFHTGVAFSPTENAKQLVGTCIFCEKEKHFFIDQNDWQWDCKRCGKKGNLYTFLKQIHAMMLEPPVQVLAEERGIPFMYFQHNQVRLNQFLSRPGYNIYAIPTFNKAGALNNLYKVIPNRDKPGKRLILCTPSLSTTLFNFPATTHQTVWLLEGHWDKLAAEAIVEPRPITCIGWPGNAFKPSWSSVLAGKDVFIFPDADDAGNSEVDFIIKKIESTSYRPKSLHVIRWPEDTPKGFDVNDVLRTHGPSSFSYLESLLVEYEPTSLSSHPTDHPVVYADESCDTYEKLAAECESSLYYTHDMDMLLILMLTSLYSLRIEGEQIWVRPMAPPGSSKTTVAKIVGASDSTVMRDTFTGLLSGWDNGQKEDVSLVPLISDKALIVKDADALIRQPNFPQIMSEMRAFYDKDLAVSYKTGLSYDYQNRRSSFIFIGTTTLRVMDDTSLGERFLDYELHVSQKDRDAISEKVYENSIIAATTGISYEDNLKSKAKGFIDNHLLLRNGVASLGPAEKKAIQYSGSLISFLRARVSRDYKGNIKYKPHPEVPSRIVGQLTKLFLCAPIIFNTTSVPKIVHQLARHITLSIINVDSLRYRVSKLLQFQPEQTGDQLCRYLHPSSPENVLREVENMYELGMLDIIPKRTSTQHQVNSFKLKDFLTEQFDDLIGKE